MIVDEERTRSILDHVVDAIVTIDESGVIESANRAAERIFGYPEAELIGRNVSLLMPEPDRSEHGKYLNHYLTTGEARIIGTGREVTGRRRDGTTFPCELSIGEFRSGGQRHFTGVIRDITERKRGEEANAHMAVIVESSDDAIISKDLDGVIQSWNAGAARIFGYRADEVLGRSIRLLIPDERLHEEAEILGRIRQGERVEHYESVRVTKEGGRIDVSLTVSPIRDRSERIIGASKIARDITDRRRAEEANARLAAIVGSSDDAIFGTDLDGLITSWNGGAERIFGYRAKEVVGRPVGLLFPSENRPEGPEILRRIGQGERVEPYESVRVTKDGRRIDVSLTVSPIRDRSGRIVGTSRIARDITDRRRAAQALEQLARLLDQAFEPIIVWQMGGGIRSWNRGAGQLYGFAAAEALGQAGHDLLRTEFPEGRAACDAALREQGRWEGELRQRTKDGRWLTVESRMSLVRMADRHEHVLESNRDVTDRKLAEEALRDRLELQHQLTMIATSVPGVICSFRMRPDGGISMPFAMPAVEDLYGFAAGVLADDFSPVYANVHPDDAPVLIESVAEAFRHVAPWHCKFRYRHPVKGERWIEGWSNGQAELNGSVLWHGFLMDVTEHAAADMARRESERIARSVLDALSTHIALLDGSGLILNVNRAWRTFAAENGATRGVEEGADYLGVCDAATGESREIARAFAAGIRGVLAGQRSSFEMEYPCHSPTERRWFVGRVSPFVDDGPRGAVVTHQNITARRLARDQLGESERMLSKSQEMAHVGSWKLDVDDPSDLGRGALQWSDECYRIFGYEPGQVAVDNERFFEAVHPDDRDRVRNALIWAVREKAAYSIEHRIVRPDGIERSVVEWGEIIADPGGRPIRVNGTCQDITERKQAEVTLEGYTTRLENLRAIDRAILSSHSVREIAQSALEHLGRHLAYWTGGVGLFDADRGEIEVIANDGILREWHPPGTRLPVDLESRPELMGLRHGRISIGADVRGEDLETPLMKSLRDAGMRSYALLPMRDRGLLIGTLFLVSDRPATFSSEEVEVAREVADHVAIAVRQAQLFEEVEAARSRLVELSRRLIRAQEDERHHIARELHDEIGQALSAIKIHLDVIGRDLFAPGPMKSRIAEGVALLERTLRQIRSISLDLRPLLLDDFGLVSALRSFLAHQSRIAGFAGRFDVTPAGVDFRLEPELETTCFRVAQEALTNISRHAGARKVEIELRLGATELELEVRDDGAGFDVAEARLRGSAGTNLGLVGMQERVGIVGGRITIRSTPGQGTEISARFPLSAKPIGEKPSHGSHPRP